MTHDHHNNAAPSRPSAARARQSPHPTRRWQLVVGVGVLSVCVIAPLHMGHAADGPSAVTRTTVAPPPTLSDRERTERLARIHRTLETLAAHAEARRQAMANAPTKARQRAIGAEIAVIDKRIDGAQRNFDALAADATLHHLLVDPRHGKRDLIAELEELLGPVLDAFRRMSARPRRIEQLRRQIETLTARRKTTTAALRNIDSLVRIHATSPWAHRLRRARTRVAGIEAELEIKQHAKERELKDELSVDESWLDTLRGATTGFLSTKGKNILLATIAFALTFLLSLLLRKRLLHHPSERVRWLQKPLGALYGGIAFSLASAASLLTFYLLHDVLMFTVSLLILSVLFWSFRHLAPRYVQEMRLVLNLGTVREGERVVWKGLPWHVDKLGLRSTLTNPMIQGGTMHVAASELIGKHSREVVPNEPWFPAKVGDWVKLKDGMYGEISVQTLEQVVVKEYGFAPVTYATSAFLANRPQNFSGGFLIWFSVTLDHALQPRIADEVIPGLIAGVERDLAELRVGDEPKMNLLSVTYDRADEGGLVLMVQVGLVGSEAPSAFGRGRAIRLSMLQTCDQHGWGIQRNRLFSDELRLSALSAGAHDSAVVAADSVASAAGVVPPPKAS